MDILPKAQVSYLPDFIWANKPGKETPFLKRDTVADVGDSNTWQAKVGLSGTLGKARLNSEFQISPSYSIRAWQCVPVTPVLVCGE